MRLFDQWNYSLNTWFLNWARTSISFSFTFTLRRTNSCWVVAWTSKISDKLDFFKSWRIILRLSCIASLCWLILWSWQISKFSHLRIIHLLYFLNRITLGILMRGIWTSQRRQIFTMFYYNQRFLLAIGFKWMYLIILKIFETINKLWSFLLSCILIFLLHLLLHIDIIFWTNSLILNIFHVIFG